jgi:hypothetical protein
MERGGRGHGERLGEIERTEDAEGLIESKSGGDSGGWMYADTRTDEKKRREKERRWSHLKKICLRRQTVTASSDTLPRTCRYRHVA